jgi:hypothetical protein
VLKRLAARAKDVKARWDRFSETVFGQRLIKGARYALTAAIGGYLIYQLSAIGWQEVWNALPRTPWFYVVFLGVYLTLPVFQALIYGLIFGLSPIQLFPAMLKKRVYNKDVMSYSGEMYLYVWIRQRTGEPGRRVMHAIKDNAIVSSVVSTLVAVVLLSVFFLAGLVRIPDVIAQYEVAYVVGGLLVGSVLLGLGIRFRRSILKLPGKILAVLFGLHALRLLVVQGLQVVEWEVVYPEIALEIWFTFLALQIITGRIPLLPSRDLIYVSLSVELAGAVQVSRAAIAGLMLVHSMLDKTLNVLLFLAVSAWDRNTIDDEVSRWKPGERPESVL